MKLRLFALPMLVLLAAWPSDSSACGGPDYGDLSPVEPFATTLDLLLHPDSYFASWGQEQRPEMRFLYPFWKAHPHEMDVLFRFSYEGLESLPPPSTAALDAAIAARDLARAEAEARAIVDQIYAMPPVLAAKHSPIFKSAVNLLEARAGGSDPHAPSREYAAFENHVRRGIPDGWSSGTTNQASAGTWASMLGEADGWLARHPTHPLADLVQLLKVRIDYFAGDTDGAWRQAIALYPRRRVRALAEMRYLLVQEKQPNASIVGGISDLELATALTSTTDIGVARWPALWQRAEQSPASDVRTNLEERLLAWTAANTAPGKLPATFPARPENPTTLWGKLRAISLLQAHDWDRALEELQSLPDDAERTRLLAQAEVQRGHPERAAVLPGLSDDARAYVFGALLDDATVDSLCQSTTPQLRQPACRERAMRLSRRGRWSDAATLVRTVSPAQGSLWREAARLASSTDADHDLAWARFLDAHSGEFLFGLANGPYRGVSMHEASLPAGSPEKAHIRDMLMRSTERWIALEAYTRWLTSHAGAPNARDVLAEADDAYNRLTNWGGGPEFFFGKNAPQTDTVKEMRRVGAVIRRGR